MLDELSGHVVRVVRVAVHTLLLQEVDFHRHAAYALLGPVKLVVCHYKWRGREKRKLVLQRACRGRNCDTFPADPLQNVSSLYLCCRPEIKAALTDFCGHLG